VSPAVGAAAPQTAPGPAPRPRRRPGRHLRPVARPTRRRSPAVPVLVGAGIVISALFALAVMHALLIGGQIRLDGMQREVAAEAEEIRRLRLRVAELEAPDRVLDVARRRLGMVQPGEVGYLAPAGVDTGDVTRTRVEPATVPPPPEPVVEEQSAEEREVAEALALDQETATDDAPVAGGGDE
jgi:hypothetical protein